MNNSLSLRKAASTEEQSMIWFKHAERQVCRCRLQFTQPAATNMVLVALGSCEAVLKG